MDPEANLERQRGLAENILAMEGKLEIRETGKPTRAVWHYADELAELVLALDEWRRKGGFDPYSAKPKVVTLVIRDPDYENEYVEEVTGEVEVETIGIDLGDEFNGPKDFDADADWGKEWIEETRESVAHLPEDGPIRQRVDELINHLTEETE